MIQRRGGVAEAEADAAEVDVGSSAGDGSRHAATGERRQGKRIIKTVTAALSLFAIGSIMIWLGVNSLPVDHDRGVAMLVLGSLTFIPGSYASFVLLGAWCRWDGYRYSDLPSYDD